MKSRWPVRAFPIGAPDPKVLRWCADGGMKLAWIEEWSDISPELRDLVIEEELDAPRIHAADQSIIGVSSFATPPRLDRGNGPRQYRVHAQGRGRYPPPGPNSALLIADSHGIQFLIRDTKALDKHGRKILDRFL
jgi:hypothetical protein